MRSIETEGAVAERRSEGCAFAFEAFRAACREHVEFVEIARDLAEALEELVQALRVADVGFVLQGPVDVSLAQQLAGAVVDEDLHGVFEEADAAFEFGAVFRPVGVACQFFGIIDPAHHHAQP